MFYKSLNLKSKMDSLSEDEMLELLSSNGMLVKRPLVIGDNLHWWVLKKTLMQIFFYNIHFFNVKHLNLCRNNDIFYHVNTNVFM